MRIPIALLLAACATTSPAKEKGGPRGLRASEHLDVASQENELAHQRATWMETRTPAPDTINAPGMHSWDPSREDHERLARLHRSEAGTLQASYEEACGARSFDQVSVSPFVRYGIGGSNTSTGVILYLTPAAGPPERLLADLKCHRAWMMLAPADMDDCPLDLPGLRLDAQAGRDVITVSIVVTDPKLVDELQRRTARDLVLAEQLRTEEPR